MLDLKKNKDVNLSNRSKKRYPLIDFIRGFAVALMIYFHLFYDLTIFKFTNIDFVYDEYWYWLPRLIVFLFLISVGIGQCLEHSNGINKQKVYKRTIKIGFLALVFTIVTYFAFPRKWIFFGTLHCILAASLLSLFFLNRPRLSLLLSLTIFSTFFGLFHFDGTKFTIPPSPNSYFNINSMDFIPIFPWFGVTLFGIFLYHQKFHHFDRIPRKLSAPFEYMGKNALLIYVLHQPILFGLTFIAAKLIK